MSAHRFHERHVLGNEDVPPSRYRNLFPDGISVRTETPHRINGWSTLDGREPDAVSSRKAAWQIDLKVTVHRKFSRFRQKQGMSLRIDTSQWERFGGSLWSGHRRRRCPR